MPFCRRPGKKQGHLSIDVNIITFTKKVSQGVRQTGSASSGLPKIGASATINCLLISIDETASLIWKEEMDMLK